MIGYGLAGLCRRWLVYPPDLIWPRALLTSNFLNTMHRDVNNPVGRWTISRYKLFFIAGIACFAYQILPQFISFLRSFPILPMIWPKSKIVNTLFGPNLGLALLSMTMSWQTVVTFLGILTLFTTPDKQTILSLFRRGPTSTSLGAWCSGSGLWQGSCT